MHRGRNAARSSSTSMHIGPNAAPGVPTSIDTATAAACADFPNTYGACAGRALPGQDSGATRRGLTVQVSQCELARRTVLCHGPTRHQTSAAVARCPSSLPRWARHASMSQFDDRPQISWHIRVVA